MKKLFIALSLLTLVCFENTAHAYWVWSPDLGKWINPKKSAKDTPEDQFSWAIEFYNKQDWDRAIEEFEKIPEAFPNSRLAAEGVYYVGMCWEERGDLAKSVDNYQKLIDKYPYSDRIRDAIKREYDIATKFFQGQKIKLWGIPALSGKDKALDLFKHIVKNAPYGSYGDQAQFMIGEVYLSIGDFAEAQKAYQTVIDDYPQSELAAKARYQIGQASMMATDKNQYNEQSAEKAIEEFQGFKNAYPDNPKVLEADESIRALRLKKAQTAFEVAQFYENRGKWASAKVYYQEVSKNYPETEFGKRAQEKSQEMLRRESEPSQPVKKRFILW